MLHNKNGGLFLCLMDSYRKALDKTVKPSYTHIHGTGSIKCSNNTYINRRKMLYIKGKKYRTGFIKCHTGGENMIQTGEYTCLEIMTRTVEGKKDMWF